MNEREELIQLRRLAELEAKAVQGPQWSDLPGNIAGSAAQFGRDLVQPLLHPIDTAKNIYNVGAGAVEKLIPGEQEHEPYADAVGDFVKQRYGGLDEIKNTMITDPVGSLADLSMLVTGGASAATKLPGMVGKAGKVASKVGRALDPVIAIGMGLNKVGGGARKLAAKGIGGLGTFTGDIPLEQAYQAGKRGSPEFVDNFRGLEPETAVIDDAADAMSAMARKRAANYKAGEATFRNDPTRLKWDKIMESWHDSASSMVEGGHSKVSPMEARKVAQIEKVLQEWKGDPTAHTASGMDALKQRIDAIDIDPNKYGRANRVKKSVRNAVKNTIVEQVPEYADTMKAYEDALALEQDIKKTMSLGGKATTDTMLRKMQSATRNNVNANFGQRGKMVGTLDDAAGSNKIMDKLSGQALNDWMPRGLGKVVAGANLGLGNAPLLPFQSPKVMGAAFYGTGAVSRKTQELLKALGITPAMIANASRGSFQAGRLAPALQELQEQYNVRR